MPEITLTLPWFTRFAGYAGHLVVFVECLWPLRVAVNLVYARREPPAPGTPAQAARAVMEVGQ